MGYRKGGGAGKKGGAGGLLKYMGTREGVEKLPLSRANAPATKQQKSLIETVIQRIPETVQYPEYQAFLKSETTGSANEFLNAVLKQEEDAENIRKLVTYMAERPGVVKLQRLHRQPHQAEYWEHPHRKTDHNGLAEVLPQATNQR